MMLGLTPDGHIFAALYCETLRGSRSDLRRHDGVETASHVSFLDLSGVESERGQK